MFAIYTIKTQLDDEKVQNKRMSTIKTTTNNDNAIISGERRKHQISIDIKL